MSGEPATEVAAVGPAASVAGLICDVVTIGESMVLLQPLSEGPLAYAPLFTRTVAGAESNVAIGLTRLGFKVRWISRLGRDPFGDIIASTLAGEGVDTSLVMRDAVAPTAIFWRESKGYGEPNAYYYRRHSAASLLSADEIRPEWLGNARLLHVTGITPALGPSTREAIETLMRLARTQSLRVSFDPNLRRKLWDEKTARETLLSLVPLCDIFLPGREEAEFLLGPRSDVEYGGAFLEMGARLVALKLGARGSLGFTPEYSVKAAPHVVDKIVDPIGAGDAFAAGFLSVLLNEEVLSEVKQPVLQRALQRGNLLGALATQYRGDWEGLPVLAEVERMEAGQEGVTR